MNRNSMIAGLVLGLGACVASADSLNLAFDSIAGGSNSARVRVGSSNVQAGHLFHEITSGSQAGTVFGSFCIELAQTVGTGTFQIVELTEAPVPGTPFTQGQADLISAIVANAAAKGWIDGNLQADAGQSNYLGRMGAIQAAIWEATGAAVDVNHSGTTVALRDAYLELMDAQSFNAGLRLSGLKALVNGSRQDLLYVVPLPPAAFAGMGMLAAGLGVRTLRRR
jgi:hypothetical protein